MTRSGRDDDFALSVTKPEIAEAICGVVQRVAPVDNWDDFFGFEEFAYYFQVGFDHLGNEWKGLSVCERDS